MASSDPNSDRQREVASWFDSTYSKIGFKYLRPLEAYPIFLQLLGVKEGETLLDVACGPGLLLKAALMRGLRPSGVDISKEAVAIARGFAAGAEAQEGSSEKLPFADGCFRHVTCVGAIERFLDREKALSEMCRVAMADAKFCFMVRNSETAVWKVWRRWLGSMQVRQTQTDAPAHLAYGIRTLKCAAISLAHDPPLTSAQSEGTHTPTRPAPSRARWRA